MENATAQSLLSKDEIETLRSSFTSMIPSSDLASELFYRDLFEHYPAAKALFSTDPFEQGQKFMLMLATILDGLEKPAKLASECRSLGARHVAYGVQPEHYPFVGRSLIFALDAVLDERFTPEVERAWSKLFAIVSGYMLEEAG